MYLWPHSPHQFAAGRRHGCLCLRRQLGGAADARTGPVGTGGGRDTRSAKGVGTASGFDVFGIGDRRSGNRGHRHRSHLTVSLPWLAAKGVHPALLSSDVAGVLLGSAAVMVLFGLIGIGLGAIVRNQIAAVVGSLVWLLVVENLLVSLFPAIGKWLSFGASASLIGSADAGLLPAGAAALLLLGYAAAFIATGIHSPPPATSSPDPHPHHPSCWRRPSPLSGEGRLRIATLLSNG